MGILRETAIIPDCTADEVRAALTVPDECNPMPDCFGEVSEEERRRVAGNAALIAERFHVPESEIGRYLTPWLRDLLDADKPPKAYESDGAAMGDCWQVAWFVDKLGYPYDWEQPRNWKKRGSMYEPSNGHCSGLRRAV